MKHFLLLISVVVLSTSFAGCTKKPVALPPGALTDEQKAKLKLNAIKAYEQIAKDYPDSPHAAEARQRAQALRGPGK